MFGGQGWGFIAEMMELEVGRFDMKSMDMCFYSMTFGEKLLIVFMGKFLEWSIILKICN